jgi:SAM-dependent methyltransferase
MKIILCPLCRGETDLVYANLPGYKEGMVYDIRECKLCGASFSEPMEIDEELYDLIYRKITLVPGYSRYLNYATKIKKELLPLDYLIAQEESYWAVGNYLRNTWSATQDCKILEVGCGMGYFTYALISDGFDARGIDISQRAVEDAAERYGDFYECSSLEKFADKSDQRFDVAILNQLIEHIPDIRSFIGNVLNVLKPNGEIIITTPNKSAYPNRDWETELPPVHLWWLSEKTFAYLAREFGLSLTFVDFTEFYQHNYRQNIPISKSRIFDSQGNVVFPSDAWKTRGNSLLKHLHLKSVFRYIRDTTTGKKRVSGSKGVVIAAILKRT